MKKILFIIGSYLIIQSGLGLLMQVFIMISAPQNNLTTNSAIPSDYLLPLLLACSILTALATILICGKGFRTPFEWKTRGQNKTVILLLSLITSLPLIILANGLVEMLNLPDVLQDNFADMSQAPLALFVMALVGPLSEEICFRYGITGTLVRQMPRMRNIAIVVSALIFGLIHLNPAQILNATILGLFFAWLYAKTRSIWPSVVCHVANNAIAVVLFQTQNADTKLSDMLPSPVYAYLLIAISIAVAIPLLFVLNKQMASCSPKA